MLTLRRDVVSMVATTSEDEDMAGKYREDLTKKKRRKEEMRRRRRKRGGRKSF